MQAGLLRDRINFYALTSVQDRSGALTKTVTPVLDTLCARRRMVTEGMTVNAMEEFISSTLRVQVRYNAVINDKLHFDYDGKKYRITLLDKQHDNTYLITATRLNTGEL